MTDVLLATSEADSAAATAIEQHHAELSGALTARVAALLSAARGSDEASQREARDELVRWSQTELLPHAAAEEKTLYPAADTGLTALLVRSMRDEHLNLIAHVDALGEASDAIQAVALSGAIVALFDSHLHKENDFLIPALQADPTISLAELLGGMHELLG